MVTFLFWNLNRLPRHDVVARLVAANDVDIVILAENEIPDDELLNQLGLETERNFQKPWSLSQKIDIFTHLPNPALVTVFDDPLRRLTIRRLIVGSLDILLAAVHFQSKLHWSDHDQSQEAVELARELAKAEERFGHRRTVLVGDLNMNPFDVGVASSHALHAVMTKAIAAKEAREVAGREYPFFYNPMWAFFGDRTPGPAGTFDLAGSKPVNFFWNMYDQVLIRPALLDNFHDDVQILTADGSSSLASENGLPNRETGSDHFPILFRLDV